MPRTRGRPRTLALLAIAGALSGCPREREEDLRRFGVHAVVTVPGACEVRQGTGGAVVSLKGDEKYGFAYGISIIPAGEDHDVNTWARTVPGQKEATKFTERSEGPDGWTLAWTEESAGGTPRLRIAVYSRALNLMCSTSYDPKTAEHLAAVRKICASLRAP